MRGLEHDVRDLYSTLNHVRDENARLRAALKEAADELDAYYAAEYEGDHPLMLRRLERAKGSNPARLALTALSSPPAPPQPSA
jgi:phage gp36-like protein